MKSVLLLFLAIWVALFLPSQSSSLFEECMFVSSLITSLFSSSFLVIFPSQSSECCNAAVLDVLIWANLVFPLNLYFSYEGLVDLAICVHNFLWCVGKKQSFFSCSFNLLRCFVWVFADNALQAFKRVIYEDPLYKLSDWNQNDGNPCDWSSVTCSRDGNHVIAM